MGKFFLIIVLFFVATGNTAVCADPIIHSVGFANPALWMMPVTQAGVPTPQNDSAAVSDTTLFSDSRDSADIEFIDTVPKRVLVYDSSIIVEKSITKQDLQEYLDDKAFDYDHDTPSQTSLWEMFKRWFWEMIQQLLGTNVGSKIGDALVYILIAIAIAVVNIILFRSNLSGLFGGKKSKSSVGFTVLDENIHELNFPELITAAEAKGDYRCAIRLHYLWLLKRLSDDTIIQLKINKTNRDYRNEISSPELRRIFSRASIIFEYVWYGDVKIDSSNYQSAVEPFASTTVSASV